MKLYQLFILTLVSTQICFGFNLNDITKIANDTLNKENSTSTTLSNDSTGYIESGLKEALQKGVQTAVKSLSQDNGYLNNADVSIPLPDTLKQSEALLRQAGVGNYADDLIKAMNSAASQAVPQTSSILLDSINAMSIKDATNILNGSNTAATAYFKNSSYDKLKEVITPIVQKSIQNNQIAKYYEAFNSAYNTYGKPLVESSGVMDYAKSFGVDKYLPQSSKESLEAYITAKTLDGLFTMIEQEETAIRSNPVNRTTELLQKVFQ